MAGSLILVIWTFFVPLLAGGIPAAGMKKDRTGGDWKKLIFKWISGQMLLWAVFGLLAVIPIRKGMSFEVLFYGYLGISLMLALIGGVLWVLGCRKRKVSFRLVYGFEKEQGKWYKVLWILFAALLLFQLVQAVRLTYGDGDDAFYVAVSSIAAESNEMYSKLPYTGGSTGLDYRHGLAPFPLWLAFLSRISGLKAVTVCHIAAPLMLIPMTYGIYWLIGRKLCKKGRKDKLPLFLIFTELLVLFGDYSIYSVENFMIARSRQGKAALGSIIFPFLIYVFLLLLERLEEKEKAEWMLWVLLACTVTSACLCSTLGAFLVCLVTAIVGLCSAVCYRQWKFLFPMAACCIPAVFFALLYLIS